MILNRKTEKKEFYNQQNSNLPSNNIYSIISDEGEGLWIASLEHFIYFDIAQKCFTVIDKDVKGRPIQNIIAYYFEILKGAFAGGEWDYLYITRLISLY